MTCPVGEGSHPLADSGTSWAGRRQSIDQRVPTQTHDQVERNDVLEQGNHVVPVGMKKEVGQQALWVRPQALHRIRWTKMW